jgi:hypothetical protein
VNQANRKKASNYSNALVLSVCEQKNRNSETVTTNSLYCNYVTTIPTNQNKTDSNILYDTLTHKREGS